MLEGIRCYMMDRFVIKYNMLMDSPDMLCPRIRKRVEKVKELARLCIARQTLADKCEVKMGYKIGIPCLDGRQAWPDAIGLPVHPPKQRPMPGRPKKKRRRAAHELETRPQRNGVGEEVTRRGSIIHCKKCGAEGHNSRGCKATAAEIQANTRNEARSARTAPRRATRGGNNTAGPTVPAGNTTHNARTCPLNRGNGIQDVVLNVGDRRTIEREMRIATRGIGVYVSEATGNQYVRLNGSRGRPAGGTQPTEMDAQGSQPPPTQP
ncbi:unnamed protein product [Linum trigynum]|uniref:CCHC-type domain-containing protein n=1 Tax=Linum trigynum TaxID=586398 RepID=A0AAV2E137_9ROSI